MVFPNSVNKTKFKIFLQEIRDRNLFNDVLLVMDNLPVHKSPEVVQRMDELGFAYAWVPPHSPQYNGIEEVFSIAKR